jgi:hypothetical protein
LRTRYPDAIAGLFRWWGASSWPCCRNWRALLAERSEALLFEIRDGAMIAWRQSGGLRRGGERRADAPDAERTAALERVRGQIDDPNLRSFYHRLARALRREFALPAAAENNLRRCWRSRWIGRRRSADQVYFDYRLGEREAAARNLRSS